MLCASLEDAGKQKPSSPFSLLARSLASLLAGEVFLKAPHCFDYRVGYRLYNLIA